MGLHHCLSMRHQQVVTATSTVRVLPSPVPGALLPALQALLSARALNPDQWADAEKRRLERRAAELDAALSKERHRRAHAAKLRCALGRLDTERSRALLLGGGSNRCARRLFFEVPWPVSPARMHPSMHACSQTYPPDTIPANNQSCILVQHLVRVVLHSLTLRLVRMFALVPSCLLLQLQLLPAEAPGGGATGISAGTGRCGTRGRQSL